jgi:hypothetical protein
MLNISSPVSVLLKDDAEDSDATVDLGAEESASRGEKRKTSAGTSEQITNGAWAVESSGRQWLSAGNKKTRKD